MTADWQIRKAQTFAWWSRLMLTLPEDAARETLRLLHKHADDALSPDANDIDDMAREALRRLKRHQNTQEALGEIQE